MAMEMEEVGRHAQRHAQCHAQCHAQRHAQRHARRGSDRMLNDTGMDMKMAMQTWTQTMELHMKNKTTRANGESICENKEDQEFNLCNVHAQCNRRL